MRLSLNWNSDALALSLTACNSDEADPPAPTTEQGAAAQETRDAFAPVLKARGYGDVTTEIRPVEEAGTFYYAEDYHQQYLKKNPAGYCPVHSTGVACPVPSA